MSTPYKHHVIAAQFAVSMDAAIVRYKSGEEEVTWTFDEFTLTLRNLKDNADREVVRFTLGELREVAMSLVAYGACKAGQIVAYSVADQFGAYSVADQFGLLDEGDGGDSEVKP